jgi:shikimate dehydrogenase
MQPLVTQSPQNPRYVVAIIGNPVFHTMSPSMHNAGYQHLGLPFTYVPFEVEPRSLGDALAGAKALGIRGLSVTIPFKESVIPYLDEVDPLAARIGAVNTIVIDSGRMKGFNTDVQGVVVPLERRRNLDQSRIAIMGSGGAARAAAFALREKGAIVTICARNLTTSGKLVSDIDGLRFLELSSLVSLCDYDIVVNATPAGMNNDTPFLPTLLSAEQIVFDMVYKPRRTILLQHIESLGGIGIEGVEMLLHQGMAQFKLFTGVDAPEQSMRAALGI